MKNDRLRKSEVAVDQDIDEQTVEMGNKIAALRKERGLTLQQASRLAGVAASTLSKIERHELSPTISTLSRIASGYGLDVVQLLSSSDDDAAPQPQPLAGRRSITRAGKGRAYSSATCLNELLCHDLKHKRLTPIYTRIEARTVEDYATWPKSDTEIFLYVVKGILVVNSQLYEPIELYQGDSMYYDASTEHIWISKGPVDAEILWVITSSERDYNGA